MEDSENSRLQQEGTPIGVVLETAGNVSTLGAPPMQRPNNVPPTPTKSEGLGFIGTISLVGDQPVKVRHVAYVVVGAVVIGVGLQVTHRYVPGCPAPFGRWLEKTPALPVGRTRG